MRDQCPQIPKEQLPDKGLKYNEYIKKLCDYYRNKKIPIFLVIDQINSVASAFRK